MPQFPLEAKRRVTHGERKRAACMCETFVARCYFNSSVQNQILCLCISCRSEMQRGEKNWLSGLWNILFLISSESTERERSLDFGTLTPVTCRSSWEWLQFISQVGESWVIGGRTRGKLNSSCAETRKARFIQLQRTCSKSPAKVKDSEERRAAQVWRRLLRSDNNLF